MLRCHVHTDNFSSLDKQFFCLHRSRDNERERQREKERERKKKGLPPVKENHISSELILDETNTCLP